jgi:hypothetical protein
VKWWKYSFEEMNILSYKKDFGDTSYYKLDYLKMKSMKCKGFVLPNHIPHPRVKRGKEKRYLQKFIVHHTTGSTWFFAKFTSE